MRNVMRNSYLSSDDREMFEVLQGVLTGDASLGLKACWFCWS